VFLFSHIIGNIINLKALQHIQYFLLQEYLLLDPKSP